jgi:hypothetical protein
MTVVRDVRFDRLLQERRAVPTWGRIAPLREGPPLPSTFATITANSRRSQFLRDDRRIILLTTVEPPERRYAAMCWADPLISDPTAP